MPAPLSAPRRAPRPAAGTPRRRRSAVLARVAAGDDRGPLDRLAGVGRPGEPDELRVRPGQRRGGAGVFAPRAPPPPPPRGAALPPPPRPPPARLWPARGRGPGRGPR